MDRFLNSSSGSDAVFLAGRYRVLQTLGEVGAITTYLAEDSNRFQERCKLWVFEARLSDPLTTEAVGDRFHQAAALLYQLHHPQIPRFRELLQQHGDLILVQDYVEGLTYQDLLHQRRSQGRLFSALEVTQLLRQLLPVLQYLQGLGIVHREITAHHLIQPQDGLPVLVTFAGEKTLLTRAHQGQSGWSGERGDPEPRWGEDLTSLGVTALGLLTGEMGPQPLVLEEPLSSVLSRLMAPAGGDRFANAAAVLAALGPRAEAAEPAPAMATLVAAPAGQTPPPVFPPSSPPQRPGSPRSHSSGCGSALLGLLVLLGIAGGLWWWLDPMAWKTALKPSLPSSGQGPGPSSQGRAELRDRALALGINPKFLVSLTDTLFYQQYPERQGQVLTDQPEDGPYRDQWQAIAQTNLNWMAANLTQTARQQLGQYRTADFERWSAQAYQLHVGSKALARLTDGRFNQFVIDPSQSQDANTPLGQIWLGLAQDSLTQLVKGQTLKDLEFAPGSYGQQVEANLAPGQGQVYTLQLRQGQLMRMNLQAPAAAIRLSIYVPSPHPTLPYILDNSFDQTWAGPVPQSGYYEIVLIGQSQNPVTYRLALAVDNLIDQGATPPPEPTN